jgi:hypothetical protein
MRVYHFLSKKWGLEALRNQRLKISRINELNDPFELSAITLSDKIYRKAVNELKREWHKSKGLICFTRNWTNPLLWSHYANKHAGLCLGFNVPNASLMKVNYIPRRISPEKFEKIKATDPDRAGNILMATKFVHWKYETEERFFTTLNNKDPDTGFYYLNFSDQMKLRSVMVGANSKISRKVIRDALGDSGKDIERFKVRAAFKSFKITRNLNPSLWR